MDAPDSPYIAALIEANESHRALNAQLRRQLDEAQHEINRLKHELAMAQAHRRYVGYPYPFGPRPHWEDYHHYVPPVPSVWCSTAANDD